MPARALLLAALLPPLAATTVVLAGASSRLAPPRHLAEAAATGSAADVLRMLRAGESPTQLLPVTAEVISSSIARVTPLEAAVWSRQAALIELLDRQGAIADAATRQHIACLAADLGVADAFSYLAASGPIGCTPGETLAAIAARPR